jgi:uncharacterized protein YicC (UPF0701 family)
MLAGFMAALEELKAMRLSEGAALNRVLGDQIDRIEELTRRRGRSVALRRGDPRSPRRPGGGVMDTGAGLDRDRLHMEAALLATKADLREEIDRLKAHVDAARTLACGAREAHGPPAGFSRPGIQPRNQYHMFEIQCGVGDRDRA